MMSGGDLHQFQLLFACHVLHFKLSTVTVWTVNTYHKLLQIYFNIFHRFLTREYKTQHRLQIISLLILGLHDFTVLCSTLLRLQLESTITIYYLVKRCNFFLPILIFSKANCFHVPNLHVLK